jgi:rod shape-determining protein MreC
MLDIRRRTGLLFLAVTLAQIVLISAQVQSKAGVPVIESVTFGAFSRVQGVLASAIHGTRHVWGSYVALRGAHAENEQLRRQVGDLEVRLQEQRALAARAVQLQELVNLRSSTELPLLAADVIAGNPNPGMRTLTINRGSSEGVMSDMAVISPKGIVGRIVGQPAAHASIVQLLIDHNAAAGAIVERSRAAGMVVGSDQDPPMSMDLVSSLSDIKGGDVVVASGVDGIYPRGFVIGQVQTAERGPGLYYSVTVRPAVDFTSLQEVLVVLVPSRPATAAESTDVPRLAK